MIKQEKTPPINRTNTVEKSSKMLGVKQNIIQQQPVSNISNSLLVTQQKKKLDNMFGTVQNAKKTDEEEKFPTQGKLVTQRVENKTGMPENLKTGVEQLSGLDMSDVRVHYNSVKPSSVQAHAYTQGTDIHVAPGQEKHLGHEAWHVAQQKQGRVQPTTTIAGMPVNDNVSLEKEADVMGVKASGFNV